MTATIQLDKWQETAFSPGISALTDRFKLAVSEFTKSVFEGAEARTRIATPSARGATSQDQNERAFQALAEAKVLTSEVAMHLPTEWRVRLFRQLDSLHDLDEWEEGDKPLDSGSFATFLRAVIALNIARRPGLGLTPSGNLIASWTHDSGQLTLEFRSSNTVQWIVSRTTPDGKERAAGVGSLRRLAAFLAPYEPAVWLSDAE